MSERPPRRPVEVKAEAAESISAKEQEQLDEAAYWAEVMRTPVTEPLSPEALAQKFEELETLLTDFEQRHDLEALHAVVASTIEEAKASTIREAAKAGLPSLADLIFTLREKHHVLGARPELYARYCAIQRAIGTLNNGEIRHDMPEEGNIDRKDT